MGIMSAAFIKAIKECCIVSFNDARLEYRKHFYVFIPIGKTDNLLLSIITSKVEKRMAHAKRQGAMEGLVPVSKKDIACLAMESVIDCNQTTDVSKDNLRWLQVGSFRFHEYVGKELKSKVFTAIRKSPVVIEHIKNMVSD